MSLSLFFLCGESDIPILSTLGVIVNLIKASALYTHNTKYKTNDIFATGHVAKLHDINATFHRTLLGNSHPKKIKLFDKYWQCACHCYHTRTSTNGRKQKYVYINNNPGYIYIVWLLLSVILLVYFCRLYLFGSQNYAPLSCLILHRSESTNAKLHAHVGTCASLWWLLTFYTPNLHPLLECIVFVYIASPYRVYPLIQFASHHCFERYFPKATSFANFISHHAICSGVSRPLKGTPEL